MADEKGGIRGLRPDQMSDKAAAEWWKEELERKCEAARDEIVSKQAPTLEQREQAIRDAKKPPCPNCGKPGHHWAPPSLGEPGFYVCGHPYADTDVTFEHPPCEMLASKPFPGVGGNSAAEIINEPRQEGDPIDLMQKRTSPYVVGRGRLYFEDQLVSPLSPVFGYTGRLNKPAPEPQWIKPDYSFKASLDLSPALTKARDEFLKASRDAWYAKTEARILGYLLSSGAYADQPEVISAKIMYSARKKCDTALVTLAVAKVIDIPVRFRWEEQFAYYTRDAKTIHIDLESPGGSVAAPYEVIWQGQNNVPRYGGQSGGKTFSSPYYLAAMLERRFRVMSENAIKYGGDPKKPFYRDFDKRKR